MSILLSNIKYTYMPNSPFEKTALNDVTLEINSGEFIGLIGHTGSGKSTLVQLLNGLLKPSYGKVLIDGVDIWGKNVNLKEIRGKVGLCFQYPEYQLFEETVFEDIAFGPKNMGVPQNEIENRVLEAISFVGLDEKILKKSPFEISGGQKRRVAIAGVIAMKPKILILDEPTAGLDPKGRDEILNKIKILHKNTDMTVILVSHSMEDIAKTVSKIVVMNKGKIELSGSISDIFMQYKRLEKIGLSVPQITKVMYRLYENGFPVCPSVYTIEDAKFEILKLFKQ